MSKRICQCKGHTHNSLADRYPEPNGYCLQCPCTVEPFKARNVVLINRRYFHLAWSKIPPTGRRWKYKRRPRVKSIYVQVLWLNVVVWYG